MSYDDTTAVAKANPDKLFIKKPDTVENPDIDMAMLIALGVVYLLIGLDILDHISASATMREYVVLMWKQGFIIEYLLHFIMICCQVQYSLLLAYYSFYVVY